MLSTKFHAFNLFLSVRSTCTSMAALSGTELPQEIISHEILIRLPVKLLVRFKCVSKSWLSLFSDSKFVKDHQTRDATQNPNDYDCLVASKHRLGVFILSRYEERFALPVIDCEAIGSIHGLVGLHANGKLSLWNPAIHQSKEFTLPPCRHGVLNNIGLGFDPVSNDYKVVVCYMSHALRYAMVYSSNFDQWTDVFVPAYVYRRDRSHSRPDTIVKNCPYWSCTKYPSKKMMPARSFSLVTVKFDVGSNEFKLLPEFYVDVSFINGNHFKVPKRYQFINVKDCLTLVAYQFYPNSMLDVFSLDDEGCGVWSKVYSLKRLNLCVHRHWSLCQGFKYGDEIVFHDGRVYYCYDHKTETIKKQLPSTKATFCVRSCFTYTPSLVFIQGMKSVYSQAQSHTRGLQYIHYKTPRRLVSSLRD